MYCSCRSMLTSHVREALSTITVSHIKDKLGSRTTHADYRVYHGYASNTTRAYTENSNPALSSLIFNGALQVRVGDPTNNFGTSTYQVSADVSEQKRPKDMICDGP